jgi:hypothetical protein
MADYIDRYKAKVKRRGSTRRTQKLHAAKQTFSELVNTAPNSHYVEIIDLNGNVMSTYGVVDDIREVDNREDDDKKWMFPFSFNIEVGYQLKWSGKTWLCTVKEENTVNSHVTGRFTPCNIEVKFLDDKGNEYSEWGICTNKTLYSDGVRDTAISTIPNQKMHLVWPNKPHTNIPRDKRVMLFSDTYKVTNIDRTKVGLMQYILTEAPLNDFDSIEHQIADYHNRPSVHEPILNLDFKGAEKIFVGSSESYEAYFLADGVRINSSMSFSLEDEYGNPLSSTVATLNVTGSNSFSITTADEAEGCEIILYIKDDQSHSSKLIIPVIGFFDF